MDVSRGEKYRRFVVETFEDLNRDELELLAQIARVMDRLDELNTEIEAHGAIIVSRGVRRPSACVIEERQLSQVLGRLMAQLGIPYENPTESMTSQRARRAAQARWNR